MMLRLLCLALVLLAWESAGSGNQVVDISPTLVLPSMSGRDIFRYYCTSCHGRDGRGDGPVAAQLKTRPANLTTLTTANGGQFPLERVRAFVTHGRTDAPSHGSPDMPIWGPIFQVLDPSDAIARMRINNVVDYIQSIQSK
ncbi:MAG TPA: c-type cytochrome [Vicinamibacterales bacterium]|jgi:mono/diheme cytochrome c family protein|nr:c-type cytochrome [Vicinamibacterales bacterium]